MTKKRIPWPPIGKGLNEAWMLDTAVYKFILADRPINWNDVSYWVNYHFDNARTPDACRRKWGRMKGK